MAEGETSVDKFLGILGQVAVPAVNKWIYGGDDSTEEERYQQTLRYRRIAGTGPIDAQAALNAPAGVVGMLFGFTVTDGTTGQSRLNPIAFLVWGGLAALLGWLVFRRR